MVLDAHNPIPLYYQLKTIIEGKIVSGELKPGDKIPSENSLCKAYNVSRTTVRQAIAELTNSGKVLRTQGRGTYVAQHPFNMLPYRLTGFSADMKKQGYHPSSKILDFKIIIPSPEIANNLRTSPAEAVIFLRRLRYIDSKLMGIENTYMPFARFPTLIDENLEDTSLYEILINKFDTIPTRVTISFEAVHCANDICELLQITENIPLLHINDITFDQNDRLIEFSDTYYRGDYYAFHVEIDKQKNENLLHVNEGQNKFS
jgi:GntR family transcriptional regulator